MASIAASASDSDENLEMVTDIRSSADFRVYGLRFLNLGWANALSIALDLDDAHEWIGDLDEDQRQEFVQAAEPELATALALVEQGVEFLLKSKIAEVSPWLLLSKNPDGWPRKCDKEDKPFAEFHTLDAQDLVRVHDTVCEPRLPEEFVTLFRELRRKRNSLMHTVDRRIKATVVEVMETVLIASHTLAGQQSWAKHRSEFIDNDRDSKLNADGSQFRLAREFIVAMKQLSPDTIERFIGLPKQTRHYLCPSCRHSFSDAGVLDCRTAVLTPNTPTCTSIRCYVCSGIHCVERRGCIHGPDCRGNVIDPDWNECLTCGSHQQ